MTHTGGKIGFGHLLDWSECWRVTGGFKEISSYLFFLYVQTCSLIYHKRCRGLFTELWDLSIQQPGSETWDGRCLSSQFQIFGGGKDICLPVNYHLTKNFPQTTEGKAAFARDWTLSLPGSRLRSLKVCDTHFWVSPNNPPVKAGRFRLDVVFQSN